MGIFLTFVCMAFCASSTVAQTTPPSRTVDDTVMRVSASGQATIRVVPSRATLFFVVDVDHSDSPEAAKRAEQRAQAVVNALKEIGVSAAEIATIPYSVNPTVNPYGNPNMPASSTFTARILIRVLLDKLDRLPTISGAAMAAGATIALPPQYAIDDIERVRKDAIRQAASQAHQDAEVLAAAMGGRLGRMFEMSVNQSSTGDMSSGTYMIPTNARMDSNPKPLPDVRVTVMVTGRWEFVQN
jgi:uncharacterized protein YggE